MMTQPKQAVLIYNPIAGSLRRDPQQVERLRTALAEQGIFVKLQPTAYAGHATLLARQAVFDGVSTVIVAGGDGTINEAAQSLVGTETALAVWPGGTANVLVKELRLPKNAKALASLIAGDSIRTISVGRARKPETGWQRYFLLMAGIGLDAAIVNSVDLELKKVAGKGAYWAAGLDFLARMPLTPFSLKFNGRQHPGTFAVISNAACYASVFTLAPGACIDDDKFNVCVFNTRSRLAYLSYAFLSLTGSHKFGPGVVYQETGEAHANSNDEAPVQLDGDVVGKLPMDFDVIPQALRIYAPLPGNGNLRRS
ncbi:MAG TPA: diacylglycerol kinase family lipid kinase [Blastocatellia bacterium]|nr:diacylglycerol kinase family lipid kinase [Blastocatellia bacterium]HMZ18873.1 diacylglycerol kinase family lipid kinase [Blastocatellia bacterium]HNG30228.1 diacylglycerol kinase family lipid kinase [Blastocatellia bacterium]